MNKKIKESQRIIKAEKKKIKAERKKIRKEKYKNNFFYNIINKSKNITYTHNEMKKTAIISIIIGALLSILTVTLLFRGKNILTLSNDLNKFFEAYDTITKKYYGEIDKNKLVDSAIYGMLSSVDDNYTTYSTKEYTDEFNELVNGTYEGIGCTIKEEDKNIIIVEVFDNSPAKKSGLKEKDIILKVDDQDAKELGVTKLSTYIRTKNSSEIELVIKRDDKENKIKIKRDKVEMPAVTGKTYEENNKKIGYIDISLFTSVSHKQFKEELLKLEKEQIQGLIIDVRGNNGGYLTSVVDIASQLLPKGQIIYKTQKKNKITAFKDETKESRNYPIAVLTDSASASASEILAASIKESYNGFVIGTTTFGKGTVQQVKTLPDGSMLKYTIENWLSPKGNWIDGNGVTPTNEIKISEEYKKNPTENNDNQLKKALELVSK